VESRVKLQFLKAFHDSEIYLHYAAPKGRMIIPSF